MFITPKKPSYSKVSTINSYAWCVTPFQSIFLFSSIFQLKTILLCKNLVIKALKELDGTLYSLPLINLNHCDNFVVYACTYKLELAEPCYHGERFQHCTCTLLYSVDIMFFCLWMSPV